MGLLFIFFAPVALDASFGDAVRYAVWTSAWLLCGAGVVAAMSRLRGSLRWSLGAVVGIMLQLVNWAAWQAISQPGLTVVGGVVAFGVGAALLWRHRGDAAGAVTADTAPTAASMSAPPARTAGGATRVETPVTGSVEDLGRTPVASAWLWVALTVWLGLAFLADAAHQSMPPGTSTMYQDLYWHLGLVGELEHALVPMVPQAKSGHLNYHWLSDAYMASGSLGSFASTLMVALRLWMLPIIGLTLALTLVVTARLSGSWVAGNVAMIVLAAPASVSFLGWVGAGPHTPFIWVSPSQVFGLVFTLWALYLFAPILRGERVRGAQLALAVITVFVCAGAKSSILPVFGAGAAVVLVLFIRNRRVRRGALTVGVLCAVGIVMALPLFAGGSAGSEVRLLSSVRRASAYRDYLHLPRPTGHGSMIPPHIATPSVFVIVLGVLAVMLLGYAYAATSVALGSTWRRDPVPLFLLGSFAGSLAAFQLIDHTGLSQGYFPLGALPLLATLTGWGFAAAWARAEHPRRWGVTAIGLALGGLVVWISRAVTGKHVPAPHAIPGGIIWPTLVMAVLVVALVVLMRRRALWGAAVLLGLGVVQAGVATADATHEQFDAPRGRVASYSVLPAESSAAFWLRDHSGAHDLVATNVHCRGVVSTLNCDRRAFWVSGFSERRMLVESWGYMDAPQKAAGEHGLRATQQPYPNRALYMTNENVFHAPTAAGVAALQKQGVRWLFGDARASKVSPELAKYATPVHTSGPVTIYRLR